MNTNTAPCVPAIRDAVRIWRENGYKGATDTTRRLLSHWFKTDHRMSNGSRFEYHYAQREAIETLIYLYEVAKARRQKDLVEGYAGGSDLRLLQYDDFARYCVKMATGSGKTKVMSLAIAWQYFNAVVEGLPEYAKTFLVLAPNVIVFERLRIDFANGRIFKTDPVIPREFSIYWDFECYMREDPERASSAGALYLTNIQQFHDHNGSFEDEEPSKMTAVLGSKPPSRLFLFPVPPCLPRKRPYSTWRLVTTILNCHSRVFWRMRAMCAPLPNSPRNLDSRLSIRTPTPICAITSRILWWFCMTARIISWKQRGGRISMSYTRIEPPRSGAKTPPCSPKPSGAIVKFRRRSLRGCSLRGLGSF